MNSPEQRLRRRLEAMPQLPPPAGLMPRVLHARQRRLRTGRLAIGGLGVLALAIVLLPRSPVPEDVPSAAAVAVAAPSLDGEVLEQIRALDRALQAGYDQGASEDELAPLWDARRQLLRQPAASHPAVRGT